MLGRLRRRLREMRYYAASRPETWRTRLRDRLLLLAVLLALPLAFATGYLTARETPPTVYVLGLEGPGPNALTAVPGGADPGQIRWSGRRAWGEVRLDVRDVLHGWPLTVAADREILGAQLTVFEPAAVDLDAALPTSDPVGRTIAEWLAGAPEDVPSRMVRTGRRWVRAEGWPIVAARETVWAGLVLATGSWWVLLSLGAVVVARLAGLAEWLVMRSVARRRRDRIRRGKCWKCGYDLEGLEWNERCPECGALTQ